MRTPSSTVAHGRDLAALVAVLLMALSLPGCMGDTKNDDDDKPMVVVNLTVLARPSVYRLNNAEMTEAKLHDQLRTIADDNRLPKTGLVHAVVRLHADPGADYDEVRDLQDFCVSVGLNHIENGD